LFDFEKEPGSVKPSGDVVQARFREPSRTLSPLQVVFSILAELGFWREPKPFTAFLPLDQLSVLSSTEFVRKDRVSGRLT
jgi:hypothetical protein